MSSGLRTKLLTLAVLVLVFASGLVVGLAVDRRGEVDSTRRGGEQVAERRDGDEADQDDRRVPMYERVGLRPGQEARIDSIVQHHRAAMRALEEEFESEYQAMRDLQKQFREAYNPRYWAIVDSTRMAIKSVLDAEQAARYDSLVAEYDQRRRSERSDTSGR